MSFTSSLSLPPNDIDTVESGCDAAGAEAGLTAKSVMLKAACAAAGASAERVATVRAATVVRIHAIPLPIVLLNDGEPEILLDFAMLYVGMSRLFYSRAEEI
jgi:hypothetical protein